MKRRHGAVWLAPVLVVVLAAVVVTGVANAIPFSPTISVTVADPTAGANSDFMQVYDIPAGDALFAYQTTLIPAEFGVQKDADVPNGAIVGRLVSTSTLGLLNQKCGTALPTAFDLMDASTDPSDTVVYADQFADMDGNTLVDGADKYPEFLTRMFPGLTPRARMFATANVGGSPVSLNFVIFEPGVTLPGFGALDAAQGYPSASIVNDNGDPGRVPAPNPITDFCAPLHSETTTFGLSKDNPETAADEAGSIVSTNPAAAGTYVFRSMSINMPDADDDNIQNDNDTCPYDQDTDVDADGDGLDDVCDPDPADAALGDADGDGYLNRGDVCPLKADVDQADADADFIGDACDNNPNTVDGTEATVEADATVEITGGAPQETATPEGTGTVVSTPAGTATPVTAVKTATPAATAVKTATPAPTAVAPEPGGGGLLGDEESFPTWAFFLIGAGAILMLGGLGTAVTVGRRRGK